MKKMSVFALLIFAALAAFIFWLIKDEFTTERSSAVYRMTDHTVYDKLLLLRREAPNGNLLLKLSNDKTVVRYELQSKRFSPADEHAWNNATEKVAVCRGTGELSENPEKYNTYGKYGLTAANSPDNSKIAVVSAYGPKIPGFSVIPFMGGGTRIAGQRYLEIKENTANYPTVGKPFRVDDLSSPSLCWTEDADLVVLSGDWNFAVSVIDLNPQAAAASVPPAPQKTTAPPAEKPDLSRLTGVVRDYGVDEDGDGLFEKIAVEVETETTVPGKYKIYLGLKSANDRHFGETVAADLTGGLERTRLLFDTKPWFDEKIEGFFEIEFIHLDYGDSPNLQMINNVGETQIYRLSQFARPNVVFTGENNVTPVDENRRGKYEKLKIEVGVDVLIPGNYEFQGDLYDEFSTVTAQGLIEFGEGTAKLNKGRGRITFVFSGGKIVEHGVSGKFRLRNVVVYQKGKQGELIENLLDTERFDVNRFESEN